MQLLRAWWPEVSCMWRAWSPFEPRIVLPRIGLHVAEFIHLTLRAELGFEPVWGAS